jgi:hypothetical protein
MGIRPAVGLAICLLCLACGSSGNREGIGRSCDPAVDAGLNQSAINVSANECPKQLCLKPAVQEDAVLPDPPTGAYCSVLCAKDSDCDGELRAGASDTRCRSGFTCAVPFTVGPLCCQKLCVCRDFLGPAGLPIPAVCMVQPRTACNEYLAPSVGGVEVETDSVVVVDPSLSPQYLCVEEKLVDADPNQNGVQPDCQVVISTPRMSQGAYQENSVSLPECDPTADYSKGYLPDGVGDCWRIVTDRSNCPITGHLVSVLRTRSEIAAGPFPAGTKVSMQCATCPDGAASLDPNSFEYLACNYTLP